LTRENPHSERELLTLIAEGDENAFREIVKQYHDKLSSYILYIVGSRPLTEEIVQDVLMKVWQHRAQLAQVQQFNAWLRVIARNYAYDCLSALAREQKKREQWQKDVAVFLRNEEEGAPSFEKYHQLLEEAIDQLPKQQRLIYQMSRRERMSSDDIREHTGLSISTIKKHRSRAIQNIKAYLKKRLLLFFC
jgi:RNA polymerase sigma-70 factor (family 1)